MITFVGAHTCLAAVETRVCISAIGSLHPSLPFAHKPSPAILFARALPPYSGGEPEKPLVVHVGRLGAEKNLELIRP